MIEKEKPPKKQKEKNSKNSKAYEQKRSFYDEKEKQFIRDREQSLAHRWVNCSSMFSQSLFGYTFVVNQVFVQPAFILAECNYHFQQDQDKSKKNNYVKGRDKFQGADKLIQHLAYLMKVHPEREFSVCYEDRFLGQMECRVDVFLNSHDIPFHRIQMFKERG